jgi:hypothetical protein
VDDTTNIILAIIGSVIAIIGTYLANASYQRRFSLIERVWEEKYKALQGLMARLSKIRTELAQYKCVANVQQNASMPEADIKEIREIIEDKFPGEGAEFAKMVSQLSRVQFYSGQVDSLRQSLKIEPKFSQKTSSDISQMSSDELDGYIKQLENFLQTCITDLIDVDFYEFLDYLDSISLIVEDADILERARDIANLLNLIRAKEENFQTEMDIIFANIAVIREKSVQELYNTKTAKKIK